jgi:hypothetical protein
MKHSRLGKAGPYRSGFVSPQDGPKRLPIDRACRGNQSEKSVIARPLPMEQINSSRFWDVIPPAAPRSFSVFELSQFAATLFYTGDANEIFSRVSACGLCALLRRSFGGRLGRQVYLTTSVAGLAFSLGSGSAPNKVLNSCTVTRNLVILAVSTAAGWVVRC